MTASPPSEPLLAGWRPADFVVGCPIVPRIPLRSTAADIALRAFLDHPLIVYGHHADVAGGLDALAETASVINRLGDVSWMSIGEIVASNSELHVTDDHVAVRPFARRFRLDIDPSWSSLTVEAPEDSVDDAALTGFSLSSSGAHGNRVPNLSFDHALSLDTAAAGVTEIVLHGTADVDPDQVPKPVWRPWPKLRRVVTEFRDRAVKAPAAAASPGPPRALQKPSGSSDRAVA